MVARDRQTNGRNARTNGGQRTNIQTALETTTLADVCQKFLNAPKGRVMVKVVVSRFFKIRNWLNVFSMERNSQNVSLSIEGQVPFQFLTLAEGAATQRIVGLWPDSLASNTCNMLFVMS